MSDTLVLLRLEHKNFIRVLQVLQAMCDRLESSRVIDVVLLRQIMDYFAGYPDCCHHPKEDVVYERLRRRDPDTARAIGDLHAEHRELAEVSARTKERVARATGGPDEGLLAALREFWDRIHAHIRYEETEVFPAIVQTLTADDWAEVDFSMFDDDDPVFDPKSERHFMQLRRAILERADESLPPGQFEGEA